MNLIAAIIISALIGFLAGHLSIQGSDPAPVSRKEAVTGDLDAPPAQFNLPRPPPTSKSAPKTAPVMCQEGTSLQEQMSKLKFFELQSICREAENDWQKRNMDAYAPRAPYKSPEAEQALKDFFEFSRESFQASAFWRGEITISKGDRTILIEIFTNYFDGDDQGPDQKRRTNISVEDPAKLCQSVAPLFTINSHGLNMGSIGSCGTAPRRKGDTFYFSWETFNDPELSPVMTALLIPTPGGRGAALEYLDSQSGTWVQESSFHWSPSTPKEFELARERHLKKIEAN